MLFYCIALSVISGAYLYSLFSLFNRPLDLLVGTLPPGLPWEQVCTVDNGFSILKKMLNLCWIKARKTMNYINCTKAVLYVLLSLVLPAHFNIAYISVEVEQRSDTYGQSHDFVELRPFGGIQIEHVEDELSQLWAVPVWNRSKCSAHDLQNQGRQILKAKTKQSQVTIYTVTHFPSAVLGFLQDR